MSQPRRPLVEVESLAKRYPSGAGELTVFADISFSLAAGESVALVGASGAGKSTLLHLLGALDRPSAGRILFDGEPLWERSELALDAYRNRDVGYVWQSYHLLPEFTALENVVMPLLIAGTDRRRAEPDGRRWLERLGLGGRAHHQAGELSGGEQQRVALARALVRKPRLLLADEPTGNLDEATGSSIMDAILALPAEEGLACLIATHNPAFAARCDRVVRIGHGALVDVSAPTATSGPPEPGGRAPSRADNGDASIES